MLPFNGKHNTISLFYYNVLPAVINSTWFYFSFFIWSEEPLTSLCRPNSKIKHAPLVFLKAVTQLLCVQLDSYLLIESRSDKSVD